MKFRSTFFVGLIALILTACNMTLAQDVTPPPGAVQQAQAQPTSGPVYPAQAPDLQNGAAIYAQECAPCHGSLGLGDGPMSAQLTSQNITVPALGSPETANAAVPANWFSTVTLGNMQKLMPPFSNKLNDQERWDVVAYAFSLSTSPEQISQGEQLFKKNCADCPTDLFADQGKMAALSTADLVNLLAEGRDGLPALGESLTQDELQAVAAYLRTLTFGDSSLAAEPASTSATTILAQTEVPSNEESPVEGPMPSEAEGTEQAGVLTEAQSVPTGFGPVSGELVNGSGGEIPSGASVTLRGFEHSTDPNSTPQEVVTQTVETNATGAFLFEDVSIPDGRIFLAEANYQGIIFRSELVTSKAGMTELTFQDIKVYENTTDSGGLVVEQLHVSFDMAVEGGVQVFELFTISNLSDKAYIFRTDGTSLPFIPLPEGASNVGLELSQNSAPLLPTESGDLAIPPSENFYSIIAFFNMPYDKLLELRQPLALPVNSTLVIVPEGIKVKSDQLADEGIQQTEQGFNVQTYSASGLNAGSLLEITLSGKVKSAATGGVDNRQILLISAGAFGVVLIFAGVWMYLRDRDKLDEDEFEDAEEEDDEFETAEEAMDAIIALDDLHRAKKIPDGAYQARRAELKERLKELA